MSPIRKDLVRPGAGCWVAILAAIVLCAAPAGVRAQTDAVTSASSVRVVSDEAGTRLVVNGRDFMVFGMNWDYTPIGTNYSFNLWDQPEDVILTALSREMPLLKEMGVNAVRQYVGVPPRWVTYIYETYGIYTILNHPLGRYGYNLDGVWYPVVDYSDPRFRTALTKELVDLVATYRATPGLLMWLLGNENNYGLSWSSFEIEALPQGERDTARARYLYSLFGETIRAMKARDTAHPVAMANGDVQYVDLIAQECAGLDIFGTNVYRGVSSRDLFQVVKDKLHIPVMFTEFGSDAFNAKEMREDQAMQARYLIAQWEEIYEQSSGKGRVGNAIGGCIFQWSDGWWKFGQESRLDIQDTNASWPNGGYVEDFVAGENNMNEEWWGLCAKGPADDRWLFELYPRAAYYALRRAFRLDPYAPSTDLAAIRAHFEAIRPVAAALEARGDKAARIVDELSRVRLSGLRLNFETISTGGKSTTTPAAATPAASYPSFRGFDHMQTFLADFEARPAANVTGTLSLSVLGRVATNPINEIFYENRGRERTVATETGPLILGDIERVKVYRSSITWEDRWFKLDGFYRTGHYHWGPEGDFFGLYREANYGENVDIYNGEAPVGFELTARRKLNGLKLAFGPQLWWGANPSVMAKYGRRFGRIDATLLYQEDLTSQSGGTTNSGAIPVPPTRKATLQFKTTRGHLGLEVGGIWSGATKIGDTFLVAEKDSAGYRMLQDEVLRSDALGLKAKLTYQRGRWNWYAQGARMGIVADAGPTSMVTYTGWSLKDSGSGNQNNVVTGLAYNLGKFQIAPNFLWQKPIIGPIPRDVPVPGRPRNVQVQLDPFAVRANRETVGAELLLCYDQTPGTWMWMWDNDAREDASLAASLDIVYRHLPTTQDAATGIGVDPEGQLFRFAFPGATPPRDLWEARGRIVSRLGPTERLVATLFVGSAEPNGDDGRLLKRYGGDGRLTVGSLALAASARFHDFGPYDYHHDFNLTFPAQLMADLSHTLGTPRWLGAQQTKLGVRGLWRALNRYSPRFCPIELPDDTGTPRCEPDAPLPNGNEWEIRSYLTLSL